MDQEDVGDGGSLAGTLRNRTVKSVLAQNTHFSIFQRLLRHSHQARDLYVLDSKTNPKTQVSPSSAVNNPDDLALGAHFQDSKNLSAPFVTWLLCWQTSCEENKGAASPHGYATSPFHWDQAAREERTHGKTDGPALNTRQNPLEGLGRERDEQTAAQRHP